MDYKNLITRLEIVSEHLFELKLKPMGATVNEAIKEIKKIMIGEIGIKCILCGCQGNQSCGCEPAGKPDHLCELDATLSCYCCNILGMEENKKRWKGNTYEKRT